MRTSGVGRSNWSSAPERILAHRLVLTECLPTNGLMTVNALVLSIQCTPLLQQAPPSTGRPYILESLVQANCDPYHFGRPPKSPLIETALRNDLVTIQLLVAWRAHVNLQARGIGNHLYCHWGQLLDVAKNALSSCYSNTTQTHN